MATVNRRDSAQESQRGIEILVEGRRRQIPFEQAFAISHQLWRADKPLESTQLLNKLHQRDPACRPVRLLLARGLARLHRYDECHRLLKETFGEEHGELASRLHDAFVMRALGDDRDAIRDLTSIAKERGDLPSVCLILGDLWERNGNQAQAIGLWQLAAQRANGTGPVAHSAAHQIAHLRQHDPLNHQRFGKRQTE